MSLSFTESLCSNLENAHFKPLKFSDLVVVYKLNKYMIVFKKFEVLVQSVKETAWDPRSDQDHYENSPLDILSS